MKVSLIVAMGLNREIGGNNDLLWHLPADMKFFRETTTGHAIVTGRKGYDAIPEKYRPLPDRLNIVVTRQQDYKATGAIVVHSVADAITQANNANTEVCYIIGGGEIYHTALQGGLVDEMLITYVQGRFPEADVFFPEFDERDWKIVEKHSREADERNQYGLEFVTYERIRS